MDGPGALVAFLSRPETYGPATGAVEVRETHMSWVFLTPRRAYKLKKAVQTEFLDFSTLAARRRFCAEEVRLNRRLAGDVYLGIQTVRRDGTGGFTLDGTGAVVDWLVVMRRLPAERMLDRAIAERRVTAATVDRLADRLTRFYTHDAERIVEPPAAPLARLAQIHRTNEAVLANQGGARLGAARLRPPLAELAGHVLERLARVLTAPPGWLVGRLAAGVVVDGHGDLRPEHVWLGDPPAAPAVIDCLEFNRDLRLMDPWADLAFLALDCDRLEARWVGERVLLAFARAGDGTPPMRLLSFYTSLAAATRARLALTHLPDTDGADARRGKPPGHWRALAATYLRLAERESVSLDCPEGRRSTRHHAAGQSLGRPAARR
ncbi:hypothetical protein CCR85_12365 [Rhodothalassium salexigens]|uniref:hypothetical protein n=1 Tax=Rhodothalassium salexigens TaxID=1086 RepID=UPI001912AC7F|nr:hypothetical protein [Rhodothalassium salexigens]MBK5912284.1 hypothetical protein [Rhodothalassium salexigens]